MQLPQVRRIVMAESAAGGSTVERVESVSMLVPRSGLGQYYVWGWDETPMLPVRSTDDYRPSSHYPGSGHVRVTANVFGDASLPGLSGSDQDARVVQGLMAAQEFGAVRGEAPGMHRTDTIDIGVVVQGELVVESTDGSRVTLGPGDVYIQNGAMHAWHADPAAPALVVFVIVGAERVADDESGT